MPTDQTLENLTFTLNQVRWFRSFGQFLLFP
jgi:hypothetical protein